MTGPSDVERRGSDGGETNMVQQTELRRSAAQNSLCMQRLAPRGPISVGAGGGAAETISGAVDGKRIPFWKGYVHTLYALKRNQ